MNASTKNKTIIYEPHISLIIEISHMEKTCPKCGNVIVDEFKESSIMCSHCSAMLTIVPYEDGAFSLIHEGETEEESEVNIELDTLVDRIIKGEGDSVENSEENIMWDILVDKIIKGEVIPVIGDDIMLEGKYTLKQTLIGIMAKIDKITINLEKEHLSYSELIYNEAYKKDKELIYGRISDLIKRLLSSFKASQLLKRILAIKQFPFVITTSIDPIAEIAMRDIWKNRRRDLKTLVFNNDPQQVDILGDISNESDLDNPTIYYMFGKAETNLPHKFVVTDKDILSFCKSWMTEGRNPKLLTKILGQKQLLFLGCNYPDWLVRFIWYSMRNNMEQSGMLVGEVESSLEEFMNRVNIKIQRNPEYALKQIEERLKKQMEQINLHRFDEPMEKTDVFLSYSRKDESMARKLFDTLSENGLNVWYDRQNLAAGDKWLEKIKRSIESTKFCVILLSESMLSQVNESHVYRKEWNMAIEHSKGMAGKRGFIIPIGLNGLNIYDPILDLPGEIPKHNALFISEEDDYQMVAQKILDRINDLAK